MKIRKSRQSAGKATRTCGAVLLFALALGLTGCGGGDSDNPPPADGQDKWDNMKWDQGKWS